MSCGKKIFKSSIKKEIKIELRSLTSYFLILLLIFSSISMVFTSNALSCPGGPWSIYIRIDEGEEEQFAHISNEENYTVTFPANLLWDIPGGVKIDFAIVNLTVEIEKGWPFETNRTTYIMKRRDYTPLSVNVTVPAGLPYNTISYIALFVNTTIFPGGKYLQPHVAYGLIKVAQYHLLDIQNNRKKITVDKEHNTIYRLNVTNYGNSEDSVVLNITNYDYLKKSGLDIDFSNPTTIDVDTSKFIDLIVKTNKNTKPGKYRIHISVVSEHELNNKDYSNQTNLTITFKIKDPLTLDDYIDLANYGIIFFGFFILMVILVKERRKSKKTIWVEKRIKDY